MRRLCSCGTEMFFPCRNSIGLVLLLVFSSISLLGPGLHYLPGASHHGAESHRVGACHHGHAHASLLQVHCHRSLASQAGTCGHECNRGEAKATGNTQLAEQDCQVAEASAAMWSAAMWSGAESAHTLDEHDCAVCQVLAKAQWHHHVVLDCAVVAQSRLGNQQASCPPLIAPRRSQSPRAPPALS